MRDGEAFLSQHLGDLTSEGAFRGFVEAVGHFRRLLDLTPEVVAHDLHPAYRSTIYAQSLEGVERVAVQHHHAHIASCLADNGVDRPVIGVAWDGSGYGVDGHVWGGEFLVADLAGFERAGHFEPVPMPGGDAAVREPWRMAAVFLRAAYGATMETLDLAFMRRLDPAAWRVLSRAADRGLNSPLTSSAGRLFDAVASLLGLRDRVAFEAQAAMELEALAEPRGRCCLSDDRGDGARRSSSGRPDVVRGVVGDLLREVPAATIAARFHATLADVLAQVCERIRERTGIAAVALSGGVFQNAWLLKAAIDAARRAAASRSTVIVRCPPTTADSSLGQAAVAARHWPPEGTPDVPGHPRQGDRGLRGPRPPDGARDFGGTVRKVCLEHLPDAGLGDYVLVHVGFALSKVDPEEAERTYRFLEELGQLGELEVPGRRAMKYLDEYRDGRVAAKILARDRAG